MQQQSTIAARLVTRTPLHNIPRGGETVPQQYKNHVAKIATIMSLVQGAAAYWDPESSLKAYGIVANNEIAEVTMPSRRDTVANGHAGGNGNKSKALGVANLGFVVEIARSLLMGEHKSVGFAAAPQVLILLLCSAVSYSNFANIACVDTVNKCQAAWVGFNCILFGCFPKLIMEVGWGMSSTFEDKTLSIVSGFGCWFIAYAVYLTGLAWNAQPIQALTWNRLCILLIHFLPSAGGSIGMNDKKRLILLAYQAVVLVGLAI